MIIMYRFIFFKLLRNYNKRKMSTRAIDRYLRLGPNRTMQIIAVQGYSLYVSNNVSTE